MYRYIYIYIYMYVYMSSVCLRAEQSISVSNEKRVGEICSLTVHFKYAYSNAGGTHNSNTTKSNFFFHDAK